MYKRCRVVPLMGECTHDEQQAKFLTDSKECPNASAALPPPPFCMPPSEVSLSRPCALVLDWYDTRLLSVLCVVETSVSCSAERVFKVAILHGEKVVSLNRAVHLEDSFRSRIQDAESSTLCDCFVGPQLSLRGK